MTSSCSATRSSKHWEIWSLFSNAYGPVDYVLNTANVNYLKKNCCIWASLINADGVRSHQAKIEVVRDWPIPSSLTNVCAFLGFCNYHRELIRNYAAIAAPLVELSRGRAAFKWTDRQQQAFNKLRYGVLSQVVNGQERIL